MANESLVKADNVQELLDRVDLWDAEQSKVSSEDSFSEIVRQYIAAKVPSWVRVSSMIAATVAPIVIGLISGTQTSWFGGMIGALAAVIAEAIIALFLYLFFVPSRIWKDVSGDLKAARSQIAEDKTKLAEMAAIARRHEHSSLEAQSNFQATESQLNTVRGQLQEAWDEIGTLKQRPKITGAFQDIATNYYYDQTNPRSTFPVYLGTEIIISLFLTNDNPTPTTMHNFSLKWEQLGKAWFAPHAEEITEHRDRDVWATNTEAERNKKMVNLVSYLGDETKKVTHDARIEGYLVFRIPKLGVEPGTGTTPEELPDEGWTVNMTLYVEDKWGTPHPIENWWARGPRPSMRLSDRSRLG